jgi:hypothetical protein
MIYGDWEEGYEKLSALFNAMKAKKLRYDPTNGWMTEIYSFVLSLCFSQCIETFKHCRSVLSIDGTFLLGKYKGTLLVAISCDADNTLVPLVFALVEG